MHKIASELVYILGLWCPAFKDKKLREAIMVEVRSFMHKIETLNRDYEKKLK